MYSIIIFYFLVIPLSIFLHELGHGFAALLTTSYIVRIYIGPDNETNREVFHLGRMRLHCKWSYTGFIKLDGGNIYLSKNQIILIALGGPLFTILIVIIILFMILTFNFERETRSLLMATFYLNLFNFIFTAIPFKYPRWYGMYAGRLSDGYRILKAIKDMKTKV